MGKEHGAMVSLVRLVGLAVAGVGHVGGQRVARLVLLVAVAPVRHCNNKLWC